VAALLYGTQMETPLYAIAGVLTRTGGRFQGQEVLTYTYARSYRDRTDAISLFTPELPLRAGTFDPTAPSQIPDPAEPTAQTPNPFARIRRRSPLPMHGCLRDAAPDTWGRRIINLRLAGNPAAELDELTHLEASGSNRIGALDFQDSATDYLARGTAASLDQLLHAAELVEVGAALPADLAAAAGHGTSIGGARPKALLEDGGRHLIAKFSSTTDTRPVVKAEAAAMLLAARTGITVAPVEVRNVDGKEVLPVERFDRTPENTRRAMVSALTFLGLGELESRYSSYAVLAEAIRLGPWAEPAATCASCTPAWCSTSASATTTTTCATTPRSWDGTRLALTPAYDLAPSPRSTSVSSQAIGISLDGRRASQLWLCREVAPDFLLGAAEADTIIEHVGATIRTD
jgi:serine/threonine-protein kinase HipA